MLIIVLQELFGALAARCELTLCTRGASIESFARLKALTKKISVDHVKNKSGMHSHEEIHKGLAILF